MLDIERFMSASATPFEIKFAPIVADIERHSTVVEREANLAHADEQKAENDLQRNFRENVQARQSDQTSKEVRLWLQPSDNVGDWRKLQQVQTAETCTWLLDKDTYNTWVDAKDSSILWIYGNPGSGKSVLASYIIEQLQPQDDASALPLIYYFCSGRDESRRASTHILRSLIFQLQIKQPGLADFVEEAYKASTTKTAERFEELWTLFTSMVKKQAAICVIDGLDECQDRDEDGNLERSTFAHRLVKLVQDQSSNQYLKVLLTSRNEPDLRVAFLASAEFIHTISISSSDVAKDIQLYISSRVDSSTEFSCLPEQMKTTIIERLESNACGMFIWARLMLEELEKCDSERAIEDALKSMPRGLFELYDRILHSLTYNFQRNEGSRDLGCFVLCWAIYSSRPLTLTELSEARCIVPGQSSLLLSKKPYSLVNFRWLIEKACSPLVEVHNDGLVQLVHHTTKDYLSQNSQRLFEICRPLSTFGLPLGSNVDLHSILSQACLSYLNQEIFENPLLGIRKRFRVKAASDVHLAHPFLDYASSNWLSHVKHSAHPPYTAIRAFIHAPQALTWIEATILLKGGVDKLATTIQYLPSLAARTTTAAAADEDCVAVTTWFEALQRVILDWGGTLNQTASEIHHLDVLLTTVRCSATKKTRLQKVTLLEDPAKLVPHMRALETGASFILCAQHVYVLSSSTFSDPFLTHYHWLSMQRLGELQFPRVDGMITWLAEAQLSVSERYVAAVKVGATKITVAVWSVSEEGFDPLSWGREDGFIGDLVAEGETFRFSHRPAFQGDGFDRSARYTAFSLDEKTIWTPSGAFNLVTGEKTPLPQHFSDTGLMCATWSGHGQRLACLRGKALEVYENDGRLTAVFHSNHVEKALIVDFSKSARYVLVLEPDSWQYSIFDLHQQSFSFLPPFKFAENENPLALKMPEYAPDYTILSHAFSPNERYICFLIDDLNHRQPAVFAVWDCQSEEYPLTLIWSRSADCRASHVQFDMSRTEILHMLIHRASHSITGGPPGFIQVDLADKSTFACLRESSKTESFSRFDICLSQRGGRVFQKLYYTHFLNADNVKEFVDVISWDLDKCPPEIEGRFTVPRQREGWQDGYAQSNGTYSDWCMFSKVG
jgi:Cdc6-like AAA superfamily ATPase